MAVVESAIGSGKPEFLQDPTKALGPDAVDRQIRAAISLCWMLLPEETRTVAGVAAEIRRITERAIANLTEDDQVFRKTT